MRQWDRFRTSKVAMSKLAKRYVDRDGADCFEELMVLMYFEVCLEGVRVNS